MAVFDSNIYSRWCRYVSIDMSVLTHVHLLFSAHFRHVACSAFELSVAEDMIVQVVSVTALSGASTDWARKSQQRREPQPQVA